MPTVQAMKNLQDVLEVSARVLCEAMAEYANSVNMMHDCFQAAQHDDDGCIDTPDAARIIAIKTLLVSATDATRRAADLLMVKENSRAIGRGIALALEGEHERAARPNAGYIK